MTEKLLVLSHIAEADKSDVSSMSRKFFCQCAELAEKYKNEDPAQIEQDIADLLAEVRGKLIL